jgi:hypothetical protein
MGPGMGLIFHLWVRGGYEFLPAAHVGYGAGILIHPWVTQWVPQKLKCIFIFNQTFIFGPAQQPAVLVEGGVNQTF